jgi:hypothetical protein
LISTTRFNKIPMPRMLHLIEDQLTTCRVAYILGLNQYTNHIEKRCNQQLRRIYDNEIMMVEDGAIGEDDPFIHFLANDLAYCIRHDQLPEKFVEDLDTTTPRSTPRLLRAMLGGRRIIAAKKLRRLGLHRRRSGIERRGLSGMLLQRVRLESRPPTRLVWKKQTSGQWFSRR